MTEIPTNQKLLDELNEVCDRHGFKMINIVLSNPLKSEGEDGELIVINRLTIKDLLKMSETEVKH